MANVARKSREGFWGVIVFVCCLLCCPHTAAARRGNDSWLEVNAGSLQRRCLLHLPRHFRRQANGQVPLVLIFHDGNSTPRTAARMTSFSQLADREGVIVAYPEALMGHWNDGRQCRRLWSQSRGVDDLAFVEALLVRIKNDFPIDEKRVYAAGMGNGAIFVHDAAARLPLAFAAIAAVGGGMAEGLAAGFEAEFPPSVLVIHGTRDPIVPFRGGAVGRRGRRGRIVDTYQTVRAWIRVCRCRATPVVAYLPDRRRDGCFVKTFTFARRRLGPEVVLAVLVGAGHVWPGRAIRRRYSAMTGQACLDFDGSQYIWSFFLCHGRK